jgi:hypothetical protein
MPNATSQSKIAGAQTSTLSLGNISSFTTTETLVSPASSTQLALESQTNDTVLPAIPTVTTAVYGSVIDAFDAAPAMYVAPSALPLHDSGTLAVDGEYVEPFTGSLGGTKLLEGLPTTFLGPILIFGLVL